jgi:hypothetical protein
VWEDLINNVQPEWETDDAEADERRLSVSTSTSSKQVSVSELLDGSRRLQLQKVMEAAWKDGYPEERRLPFTLTPDLKRKLQLANDTDLLAGCDTSWYEGAMVEESHLWPIWRPKDVSEPNVLLREDVLRDLCFSEEITQRTLIDNNLCYGCPGGGCLPPYSIVLFARLNVPDGMNLDCEQLAAAWVDYNNEHTEFEQDLMRCAKDMETSYQYSRDSGSPPESCPAYFSSIFVDEHYGTTAEIRYTSSIFATKYGDTDLEDLYDSVDDFSRGTKLIEGVYDTQDEDFVNLYAESALGRDMSLALGSAFITMIAILIHTRSPFLTAVGLLQIVLSFPLSYFVYTLIAQLDFFPFLNFLGIFVVFAIGADDVFVAVDKWKNARLEHGMDLSVAEIAIYALPDAAGAMFLTSLTTAVAFFATAICPVAPIRCFSVFCGLLIVMDYIMCVALVFPGKLLPLRSRKKLQPKLLK